MYLKHATALCVSALQINTSKKPPGKGEALVPSCLNFLAVDEKIPYPHKLAICYQVIFVRHLSAYGARQHVPSVVL